MTFNPGIIADPLDTREAGDFVVETLAAFQARRPDWVARNASPEVIYLEALAIAASTIMGQADATVGAVAEGLLSRAYQVPRLPGSPAVGTLLLEFDSTVSLTIPQDTRFLFADYGVEVATTAAVDVSASTSAMLQVATVEYSSTLNGVTDATIDLLSSIPNALSVALVGAMAGGSDPEDDATYLDRAAWRLARLTNSLVVPDHFSAYVLEDGRASNAVTIRAWSGSDIADAGTEGGHVTVVTYGRGAQLSSTVRSELATAMQAITADGVTVHVEEVDTTSVAVTATVKGTPGYASADVQAACEAALTAFLSPETWVYGTDVATGAVSAAMSDLVEVDYVDSLTLPAAAVTIPANGSPIAGTITISVT